MFYRETPEGIELLVRVVPGARHTKVDGLIEDRLKIRLQAPPVGGKANKALILFLAKRLGVSRSHVQLVHGDTSRTKTLLIANSSAKAVQSLLG